MGSGVVCAGIDVGGPRKGFHGVALLGQRVVETFHSIDANEMLRWTQSVGAHLVAVDAPCGWSKGKIRSAETSLRDIGINCFATPDRETAIAHPTGFYDWMLNGERLFKILGNHFQHFEMEEVQGPTCFETFPHGATCRFLGKGCLGADKLRDRLQVLQNHGINAASVPGIDLIDGAICALTAQYFARGDVQYFGDGGGILVLPNDNENKASPSKPLPSATQLETADVEGIERDWTPASLYAVDTSNLWRTSQCLIINPWMRTGNSSISRLYVRFEEEPNRPVVAFGPFQPFGSGHMKPIREGAGFQVWLRMVAECSKATPRTFPISFSYQDQN